MRTTSAPPAIPACSAIQPGVAPHDLHDQRAAVALRRRVHSIEGLGRDLDRGLEAEGELGAVDVVVDGLRDADDRDARRGKGLRAGHGAVPADHHQRLQAVLLDRREAVRRHVLPGDRPILGLARREARGVGLVRGAQDRAPSFKMPETSS